MYDDDNDYDHENDENEDGNDNIRCWFLDRSYIRKFIMLRAPQRTETVVSAEEVEATQKERKSFFKNDGQFTGHFKTHQKEVISDTFQICRGIAFCQRRRDGILKPKGRFRKCPENSSVFPWVFRRCLESTSVTDKHSGGILLERNKTCSVAFELVTQYTEGLN